MNVSTMDTLAMKKLFAQIMMGLIHVNVLTVILEMEMKEIVQVRHNTLERHLIYQLADEFVSYVCQDDKVKVLTA